MRPAQWEYWLSQGGAQSFRATCPNEYAMLMEGITCGVPIDYLGDRTHTREGRNPPVDAAGQAKIQKVIDADVAAGKKAGPFDEPPLEHFNVSPVGAVPKKNGKIRVIHNLSYPFNGNSVNAGVVDIGYKLSRFGHAARAVRKFGRGCYLIKLDVEAAFKQVPVRPEDWHLLGFKWLGKYFYERVLPFGLRSSCRLWELYASALHHLFEKVMSVDGDPQRAHRVVIHYVDDFLFVVRDLESARALLPVAKGVCNMLGLPMCDDKEEGPTQCLTFLGIELDTLQLQARLPVPKLQELKRLCSEWGAKSSATLREVQSLHGSLRFACAVVRPGRFQLGRIVAFMSGLMSFNPGRYARHKIPQTVRDEVKWWSTFLESFNGVSILYELEWTETACIELFTDACETGFGGIFGNRWFAGAWSPKQRAASMVATARSMPFFELYALVTAAKIFGPSWRGKKITFRCDCDPVVQGVQKGRSAKPQLMYLLRQLCEIGIAYQFDYRVIHIAGVKNVIADCLSRFGDCAQFRALCPNAEAKGEPLPVLDLLPPQ